MNSGRNILRPLTPALSAAVLMVANTSCDDHHDPIQNEEFETVTPVSPEIAEVTVTQPAALLGNLGEAEEELLQSFTNIVEADKAKVIVVDSRSIDEYSELLINAYRRGALIAVFNPESAVLSHWSDRNGIFYAGATEDDAPLAVYGFNSRGNYYYLDKSGFIDLDDEDVPLFHFCQWVNSVLGGRLTGNDLRSFDIKKRFTSQKVTHTFPIRLDEQQMVNDHWCAPGQLATTTTADVSYTIYPLHAFGDGGAAGDYYAVEAEMVFHNAALNNGVWTRRRGEELAQMCGLYLSQCEITNGLLLKQSDGFYPFAQQYPVGAEPHPVGIETSGSYDSGFSWNFDATLSGGIGDDKGNYKMVNTANWTWNNSAIQTSPNLAIYPTYTAGEVFYTLNVNGLPGSEAGIGLNNIPSIANGDLTFHYSWIWYVPEAKDNSDLRFYMQAGLSPRYQAYQWTDSEERLIVGEFGTVEASSQNKNVFRFVLVPPNRVPTGSFLITNTSDGPYYIKDIKLWRDRISDAEPDYVISQTISTPTATGGSGVNGTKLMVETGSYMVKGTRYVMQNDEPTDIQTIVSVEPITVTLAGETIIDFGSSAFTIQ
ncbi:MAG: hypothetical protein K2K26_08455 [Muribaculaceae bacterium]|nr:hypothetical protein [Muribaculaceae bacterium]